MFKLNCFPEKRSIICNYLQSGGNLHRFSTTINYLTHKLEPYYITGFVDGEGSFAISVNPHSRYSTGYRVKATFSIGLHERDLPLLQLIKEFFGVGSITKSSINGIK